MSEKKPAQYLFNFEVVSVAGQVGCLTLVIIILALISGLWLDKQFETWPLFTIIFMIASAPVTFFTILWVVKKATPRFIPDIEKDHNSDQEENYRGKTS